ncbi:hypothetical protein N9N13_00660 [Opitutales bacterium]|nr:hypothetical protein [Opitutales bacterium]
MKFIQPFLLLSFLFTLSLWSTTPVPYSGKIDIRGVNYFGDAQFTFSLHDGNGTTHWRNGNQPKETIKVTIRNGRYNVLLGGQGMNSLPPELFLNHDKLYLKVEVDMADGEGLRHLAPDQLITATPRALVADVAKVAELAKISETVSNGAITRDMLSSEVLTQLDANATASPSTPVTITREMLPQDVRDDLNKTVTITRSMLPADVLSDLNRTITKSMLGSDVLADLNKSSTTASPITLSMLAPEVTVKLDQNGSGGNTTFYNPPVVGSTLAVPHGQNAPAGYSLYHQVGQPKELVWEEKAPVSVARYAYDGVEVLGGKIYFVGGRDGSSAKNIAERYDPATNAWESIASMSVARMGVASSVLNGKLYAIGGEGLSSVEVFDPNTGNWTVGVALPSEVNHGTAITVSDKIYLVGGRNSSNQDTNKVLSFDPITNQWTAKVNMPTARHGAKLVWFENRIWAISGWESPANSTVESYDPQTDTWRTEKQLPRARHWPVVWISHERIYVGGLQYGSHIDYYDSSNDTWIAGGNLPENKFVADAVVLNEKVYVIGGATAANVYSNKVFAADLNASVDGVYDLYRKDGNASAGTPIVQAEVPDGSVTASKIASKTIGKDQISDDILKYLKPEITAQPQAQTIYADSNASFSVTAEGKYLTYQWKKGGTNLTGETNATFIITDANATQHDDNYSVVVSNDFGSVESGLVEVLVSNWGPNSIPGLELWLDANDVSTFELLSNSVSQWSDKSSKKNHFIQSDLNKRPEFSGGVLSFSAGNQLAASQPIQFSVLNMIYVKKSSDEKSSDFSAQSDKYGTTFENGSGVTSKNFGSPDYYLNGHPISLATRLDAYQYIHDGTSKILSVVNCSTISWPVFGIANYGGWEYEGEYSEIIFISGALLDLDRQKIEGYLAHKWGLTADLPSDHPYKNNAP